jgi:hypothetical protein
VVEAAAAQASAIKSSLTRCISIRVLRFLFLGARIVFVFRSFACGRDALDAHRFKIIFCFSFSFSG